MTIRIARDEDLLEILKLYAQQDIDDGEILELKNAVTIFNRIKLYPDYHVYVAEIDGKIVGTFSLAIMDNLAHMGSKSGLIEDVVVIQSLQRHGIGRQMMKFAIEECKNKLCYKVSLSSNLNRKNSHKFYKSIGFKVQGYSFLIELI
jgi:GNAT superfamily N-acetyltransferase